MMKHSFRLGTAVVLGLLSAGCGSAVAQSETQSGGPSVRDSVNPADVRFMTDMIGHHSQAILIAGWAPSHGASPEVQTLASRIVAGQKDDIVTMSNWLRSHGQPVPPHDTMHTRMAGMHHMMNMPGMLTPEQLTQLDQARGPEYDQLLLRFMIGHHRGALTMVNDLFGSRGAAQDQEVFQLANIIQADQTTEIERMQKMLAKLLVESWSSQ